MTEQQTGSPDPGEGVRAELGRIMRDPSHEWHDAWHGRQGPARQEAAKKHVEGLYAKGYPEAAGKKIGLTESLSAGGESDAEREARLDTAAANELQPILQARWGEQYVPRLASVQRAGAALFSGQLGKAYLEMLTERTAHLPDEAGLELLDFLATFAEKYLPRR